MSTDPNLDRVLGQLRAHLAAAGIAASEADIDGIVAKGFLSRVTVFEQLTAELPSGTVPDYLDAWGAEAAQQGTSALPPADSPSVPQADSIMAVAALLKAREISPVELAKQALTRIAELDPLINAFQRVLADQALAAAQRAEQAIAEGAYRGPLHGVPVAVKDLLALAGTPTTAGSKILADEIATSDSAGVERLEAAGAVIIGKTRMSEFAYSPGSNNPHYGSTRNPRNHAHDTGGSSSGSAAAVAAGMVFAALGSDTGGSIRIPASQCGIIGLKPTFGRTSLHGAVTLAWSLDHLGPLTRTVGDAALLLDVLSGYDPRDPRTRQRAVTPASTGLEGGVRGLRIGVLRDDGSGAPLASEPMLAAWRAGLATLEQQGAQLIEIDLPEFDLLRAVNLAILAAEAATFHEPMLRERLGDYGEFMRQRILAAFAYGPRAFMRAQQARARLRRRCEALFEEIDLLSTPTVPDAAPVLGTPAPTVFTGPFNALGWPAISVPVGNTDTGLPLGLQLAGRPWDDATVLRAAYALHEGDQVTR